MVASEERAMEGIEKMESQLDMQKSSGYSCVKLT
jgi:hypothetical protein